MSSQIDPNKPTNGNALTADVRGNFGFAKSEIEALQTSIINIVPLPPPVTSVAGKLGDVILVHSDIADWIAATASFVPTRDNIVAGIGYVPYDALNPAHYQTDTQLTAAVSMLYPNSNPARYQTDVQVAAAIAAMQGTVAPLMDGAAAVGISTLLARQDHVHPSDTSKYDATNPAAYQTSAQVSAAVSAAVAAYIPLTQRGATNGVASLDASGIVPIVQLPPVFTGALSYKGTWDPSTNTPVMASGARMGGAVQAAGIYYVVAVTATTAAIDGLTTWVVGDQITSNGTVWQRVQTSSRPLNLVGLPTSPTGLHTGDLYLNGSFLMAAP